MSEALDGWSCRTPEAVAVGPCVVQRGDGGLLRLADGVLDSVANRLGEEARSRGTIAWMTGFAFETLGGRQTADLHDSASDSSPNVIVAPAIGIEARYYSNLCAGLAERGIGAVAIDMPGHGASPIRAGRHRDWGYPELAEHYASACRALAELRPHSPLYMLGHSLGGHACLMVARSSDVEVHGVILVATGVPYWRAWQGSAALRLRLGSVLFAVVARALGYFPGHRFGFGGREARSLIVQWAKTVRTGTYRLPGLDGEALLRLPGGPVHSIRLRGDSFAPEAAVRHLLDKLSGRIVTEEEWESPPNGGDHNRWPGAPEFVVARVVDFIGRDAAVQ